MSENSNNREKPKEQEKVQAEEEIISKTVSEQCCNHMNGDHAVTVYAMAKALLDADESSSSRIRNGKITQAKMIKVTDTACTISFVSCSGDLCEMKKMDYAFVPQLSSANDIRPRIIEIHNEVLSPKISWLLTKPLALLVLIVCSMLGIATNIIGIDRFKKVLESRCHDYLFLNPLIEGTFGSIETFTKLIRVAWYVAFVAHGMEGLWVAYSAKRAFKLRPRVIARWYILVAMVGYPITKEFLNHVKINGETRKEVKRRLKTDKKEN